MLKILARMREYSSAENISRRKEKHDCRKEKHECGNEKHECGNEKHECGNEKHECGNEKHECGNENISRRSIKHGRRNSSRYTRDWERLRPRQRLSRGHPFNPRPLVFRLLKHQLAYLFELRTPRAENRFYIFFYLACNARKSADSAVENGIAGNSGVIVIGVSVNHCRIGYF